MLFEQTTPLPAYPLACPAASVVPKNRKDGIADAKLHADADARCAIVIFVEDTLPRLRLRRRQAAAASPDSSRFESVDVGGDGKAHVLAGWLAGGRANRRSEDGSAAVSREPWRMMLY